MGKKKRLPTPDEQVDIICDEIDRRLEQCMILNAASFSDAVQRFYDGQFAALKSLRDWLAT
jgi:hypothetical protein